VKAGDIVTEEKQMKVGDTVSEENGVTKRNEWQ
jgi:hypothetical protein